MQADSATMLEQIRSLLASEPGAGSLPVLEDTLTAGYAQALALEGERWRLQRRLAELAGDAQADVEAHAFELARLARCVTAADCELSRLRTLLDSLRDRARELRSAPSAY